MFFMKTELKIKATVVQKEEENLFSSPRSSREPSKRELQQSVDAPGDSLTLLGHLLTDRAATLHPEDGVLSQKALCP